MPDSPHDGSPSARAPVALVSGVAAVAGALLLVAWAWVTGPMVAAFTGILLALFTVALAVAAFAFAWGAAAPALGARLATLAATGLAGFVATAGYWRRASEAFLADLDMGGIPLVLCYVLAFWWPAVLVASLALIVGRYASRVGGPRHAASMLGVAFASAVAGMALVRASIGADPTQPDAWRPLDAQVERTLGHGVLGTSPKWTLRRDELRVVYDVRAALASRSAHELRLGVEQTAHSARWLLKHKDVARLSVAFEADGPIATFEVAEGDARPTAEIVRFERARLPNRGTLDLASLRAMRDPPLEHRGDAEELDRRLTLAVDGVVVSIRLDAPSPPPPELSGVVSGAYRSANRILQETRRCCPEIERFEIAIPPVETVVTRDEIAPGFLLQHRVRAPGAVLVLLDRARGIARSLPDPASVVPRQPALAGLQVFLRAEDFVQSGGREVCVPDDREGLLFDQLIARSGTIAVVDASARGDATLVLRDWTTSRTVAVRLAPGARADFGDRVIHNLGWVHR